MQIILFALWVFLPAGIANMMPVFAANVPGLRSWNYPLDFKKSIAGKRILGNHKTVRGLVIGVAIGILAALIQHMIYSQSAWVQSFVSFDYMQRSPIVFGFLLSFGALAGDSVKSFFKRRAGVASGKTWFPFDQLDYILGGLLFSLLWVQLTVGVYIVIIILYFSLHLLSTTIGYFLKLKESAL